VEIMHPGRFLAVGDRRLRPAILALTTLVAALAFAAPASAHFPVPRCGWVKPSLIHRDFRVQVKAHKPYWVTKLSPVLHCDYSERQPSLQTPGAPIVRVQFREIQRFKLSSGMVPVKGLGSCRARVSCPAHGGHKAAWILTERVVSSLYPTFTSGVLLAVEDGLNMFSIQVSNPGGPLPVASEKAAAIRMARELIPRFRYK
jgi:hypothetical protein